jgi:hypothetical protein
VIVREISMARDQTESFFHALAPPLVANILTVMLVQRFHTVTWVPISTIRSVGSWK